MLDPSFKNSVDFKNLEEKHKNVLNHYFNQNWKNAVEEMTQAKTLCKNLMADYYEMMIERINEYKKYPPQKIGMVSLLQPLNKKLGLNGFKKIRVLPDQYIVREGEKGETAFLVISGGLVAEIEGKK